MFSVGPAVANPHGVARRGGLAPRRQDASRAGHLTAYLQAHAGLGFYYQLSCVSSDRFSPLFEYEYVKLVSESPQTITSLIRSNVSNQV